MPSFKSVYGLFLINLFCASIALAAELKVTPKENPFGPISLDCSSLKLSKEFFNAVKLEPTIAWTEDSRMISSPEPDHMAFVIRILNNILDFQNQRTLGCPRSGQSNQVNLYKRFLNKKNDIINISVGIGYNDQRPNVFVWDDYLMKLITKPLLQPCTNLYSKNCGFNLDFNNSNMVIISKNIWEAKKLVITFFSSALSDNDDKNRSDPNQIEKSARAQKHFFDSLGHADYVFYLGHSRNGGGPDFFPPKLLSNSHTDYKWYNETQIQKSEMIRTLEKLPKEKKPALVGLLGCSSQLHFYKKLRAASPETSYFLSKNVVFTFEYFQGLYTFINGIQLKKTIEEINIDLEATNLPRRTNGNTESPMLLLLGGNK